MHQHQSTQQNARYRKRQLIGARDGVLIECNGQPCINFCSNDYLGLAQHPSVIQALHTGANQYGVGSSASPLVSGYQQPHAQLEQAFAEFLGKEAVLLFSSGYAANLGLFKALVSKHDRVYADKLCHASLIDACQLVGATLYRYRHNTPQHLRQRLETTPSAPGKPFIVSDSVFSMDGDVADLTQLTHIATQHHALSIIDDTHAMGVLGPAGAGLNHILDEPSIITCSLGKAFGCCGAIVAGPHRLIDTLVQAARSYIYSTALSPAMACAAQASLHLIRQADQQRQQLQHLIAYFRQLATQARLPINNSITPIQAIFVGDCATTVELSQQLLQHGFWVSAIRPPTVPPKTSRLRITLTSLHEKQQIERLVMTLSELLAC